MEKAAHPLVTSVSPGARGTPTFEVSVKHVHAFGGCVGVLRIYPDRVVYESKTMPPDSRYWRYSDVQNFTFWEHKPSEPFGSSTNSDSLGFTY